MKTLKFPSMMFIAFVFIVGCSASYGKFKRQPESESKAIQQELLDNWSDYNIRYNQAVIVLDPKNDDKKLLVENSWYKVEDQETWTQIVNGFKIVPFGVNQVWGEPIREIWVHNQFYGYVSHQEGMIVAVYIVDENTARLTAHVGSLISS